MSEATHLSDQELLLEADGELSSAAATRVRSHLSSCWMCRTRQQELEKAVRSFIRTYRQRIQPELPPVDGPRALLLLRMRDLQRSLGEQDRSSGSPRWLWSVTAVLVLCLFPLVLLKQAGRPIHRTIVASALPDRSLTPGATVLTSRDELCRRSAVKNKRVSRLVEKKVYQEYGITAAEPSEFEVDYLITPALGGADDIHNLWPQSSRTPAWNAEVKDALEDHLRDLVCAGRVDLTTAQREIATDWIQAYRKYFHTGSPPEPKRQY